ncbi:MAG: hypothetical protein OEY14_14380, partial [Myxococcales bacterium]|nr:hypothetical protein [Myxococcales bacterium]
MSDRRLNSVLALALLLAASPLDVALAQTDPGDEPAPSDEGGTEDPSDAWAQEDSGGGSDAQGGSNHFPPPPPPTVIVNNQGTGGGSADTGPATPPDEGRDPGVFWIEPSFGFSWVDLARFDASDFIPQTSEARGSGFTLGLGLGFRISLLTIGARGTLSSYFGFELGTAGAELGLRIPLGNLELFARGGLAYGWMGDANYVNPGLSETDVTGLVIDTGAGLDFFMGKGFAIGGSASGAFLNLTSNAADCAATMSTLCDPLDVAATTDGDTAGLQLRIEGHV